MAEKPPQTDANALAEQLQASNAALAGDAKAVQEAAKTADQIAAEAQSATVPAPAAPVSVPAAEKIPAAAAEAAAPEGSAAEEISLDGPPAEAPLPNFSPEVQKLLAIEVPVIVQLGVRRMSVGEVMRFSVGAIIEFQKAADEELELLANNKGIGQGHAVKVGENFGIKITRIGSVKETIRKLGAA